MTATRRKTRKTTTDRQAQAAALKDRLTQWQADADPALIALALARHDGYSERNCMLIAMQDPEATDVRGYRAWQDAGRQVGRYPEGEHGITIVSYRGDGQTKDERDAAEAAKQPGEISSDDLKASRYFALTTVHDVRHTRPLECETCGHPVHRTGYDDEAKRHQWTHTTIKADHPAKPAREPAEADTAPGETPPPPVAAEPAPVNGAAVSLPPVKPQKSTTIAPAILEIIAAASVDGSEVRITRRLDRAEYTSVNKALEAIGGKWNRKAQAHVFPEPAGPILAALLQDGTVVTASDEGYFVTPPPIVARILDLAGITPGMEVLEPSAGDGAIAGPAAARGANVDCVELNSKRAAVLTAAGYARTVTEADFLTVPCRPAYDLVLMNPPFAGQADITHVQHATGFRRAGGLLIAVMSASVQSRENRKATWFRELVDAAGGTITPLPDDAFKESGTGVRTVLVTIPAPAAEMSPA